VGVASTGDEAVHAVERLRPDVTLVDIDLGEESCLDLAWRLAHGPPAVSRSRRGIAIRSPVRAGRRSGSTSRPSCHTPASGRVGLQETCPKDDGSWADKHGLVRDDVRHENGARSARSVTSVSDVPTPATWSAVDADSRQWVEQLRTNHPRYERAVARLRDILLRVAYHELSRRRGQLRWISGPEFDDLAHQSADDALVNVLARLDEFRGLSRFTTWAYKFVVFEVSSKVARHAWRRQPPSPGELSWDLVPDPLAPRPGDRLEQRERLGALAAAIRELTERQREVFVAIALNDVSIDVLALQLGSNRNAIYKNLFDARRNLRARMAAAGHPLSDEDAHA
jgi:RNA polymerase sigma-70 factor, ECF subfamily